METQDNKYIKKYKDIYEILTIAKIRLIKDFLDSEFQKQFNSQDESHKEEIVQKKSLKISHLLKIINIFNPKKSEKIKPKKREYDNKILLNILKHIVKFQKDYDFLFDFLLNRNKNLNIKDKILNIIDKENKKYLSQEEREKLYKNIEEENIGLCTKKDPFYVSKHIISLIQKQFNEIITKKELNEILKEKRLKKNEEEIKIEINKEIENKIINKIKENWEKKIEEIKIEKILKRKNEYKKSLKNKNKVEEVKEKIEKKMIEKFKEEIREEIEIFNHIYSLRESISKIYLKESNGKKNETDNKKLSCFPKLLSCFKNNKIVKIENKKEAEKENGNDILEYTDKSTNYLLKFIEDSPCEQKNLPFDYLLISLTETKEKKDIKLFILELLLNEKISINLEIILNELPDINSKNLKGKNDIINMIKNIINNKKSEEKNPQQKSNTKYSTKKIKNDHNLSDKSIEILYINKKPERQNITHYRSKITLSSHQNNPDFF
jgi:hypothetical protein